MFSLHIDTARTWRGGQSQVMYTVVGLRQSDQFLRDRLTQCTEGVPVNSC